MTTVARLDGTQLKEVASVPIEKLTFQQKVRAWAFCNAYTLIFMSFFFSITWIISFLTR